MILQSGSTPTVLQQLSNLPFEYFSNPQLKRVLFPTLLACCVDNAENREILDQEVSYQVSDRFKFSVAKLDAYISGIDMVSNTKQNTQKMPPKMEKFQI